MSFSAFILFFVIVVWLSWGPRWLLHKLNSGKEQSPFYRRLYQLRHALPVLTSYALMALLKLIYQYVEASK